MRIGAKLSLSYFDGEVYKRPLHCFKKSLIQCLRIVLKNEIKKV